MMSTQFVNYSDSFGKTSKRFVAMVLAVVSLAMVLGASVLGVYGGASPVVSALTAEEINAGKIGHPLPGAPITSKYGMRVHPVTGVYKLHTGIDLANGCGKPILSAADGVVTSAHWNNAYGNRVIVKHTDRVSTTYNHMASTSVKAGDVVKMGQEIGKEGTTGYSTGCHLHFEVVGDGKYVDPAPWLEGRGSFSSGPQAGNMGDGADPVRNDGTGSSANGPSVAPGVPKEKAPFDLGKWWCWGPDTAPQQMYEASQTNKLQNDYASKAVITTGLEDVTTGPIYLNALMKYTGVGDFEKTNEAVLGRGLDRTSPDGKEGTAKDAAKAKANAGATVNPFERFGFAGLRWTAYPGEWKVLVVNACSDEDEPYDPKGGEFYEGRLAPKSTWDDRAGSLDIRSRRHADTYGAGLVSTPPLGMATVNTLANFIFNFTKFIVGVTIALINISFSDIVELFGIWDVIAGDNGGMFNSLYKNLFEPLVTFAILMTTVWIGYQGIGKRAYRNAMGTLFKTMAMFVAAVICSMFPAQITSAPNTVATTLQAIVVGSISEGIVGGNGMCTTDTGVPSKEKKVNAGKDTAKDDQTFLDGVTKNMRTTLDCSLWQQFLLKPWSQGQYGTDWNKMWVKGQKPSGNSKDFATVQNSEANAKMVGTATVPMGGGKDLKNWAVFQLSTQTNAHAPAGKPSDFPKITDGVANDWWRIADVMSNYSEKEVSKSNPFGSAKITYPAPAEDPPVEQWNDWVGGSVGNRLLIATTSLVTASLGLAAPLFFAMLCAMASIGCALVMMFAPFAFLMGCWQPRGWEFFKGWLDLVTSLVVTRVITGMLMVLSIVLVSAAISIMENDSWLKGATLMCLMSFILITNRQKMMNMFQFRQMSSVNFRETYQKTKGGLTAPTRQGFKFGASAAAGGVGAMREAKEKTGKTGGFKAFGSGAKAGMKTEAKNLEYTSPFFRSMSRQHHLMKDQSNQSDDINIGKRHCINGHLLGDFDSYFEGSAGELYCQQCGEERRDDDTLGLREYSIYTQDEFDEKFNEPKPLYQVESSYDDTTGGDDEESGTLAEKMGQPDKEDMGASKARRETFVRHASRVEDDIKAYEYEITQGRIVLPPKLPQEIQPFVNRGVMNKAWEERNYPYIREMYAQAWKNYASRAFSDIFDKNLINFLRDEMEARRKQQIDPLD